jgi:hypothetical protein
VDHTLDTIWSTALAVLDHNTTRGTQDVNDPDRPVGRIAVPQAGSFTSWVALLR